jgi:hypothetical protein
VIPPELLQQVAEAVERAGIAESVLAELRAAHRGVHFSWCMDDDVGRAKPVMQRPGFNLYLVDSREHCLKLTNDADVATGVLVAETGDE